jgi:hypothetical protein
MRDRRLPLQNAEPEAMEEEKNFALFIAMVIRNAMEDFHHEHLTHEQMEDLNPIIRNAVCTALHASHNIRAGWALFRASRTAFGPSCSYAAPCQ